MQIQVYFMSSPKCFTPENCVVSKLFECPLPATPAKPKSYCNFEINNKEIPGYIEQFVFQSETELEVEKLTY